MERVMIWVQTLSAVAVLAGVLLVVMQLQQNETLQRFQIATDLRINRDSDFYAARGETYSETLAKLSGETAALSDAELLQFELHATSIYYELFHRRQLYNSGIFVGDWKFWLTGETCLLFNNPTGQAWLDWVSGSGDDEIVAELRQRLKTCGPGFVQHVRSKE